MSRSGRILFFGCVIGLLAYAAIFPVLTVDTVLNVWAHAARLESRNFYLLMFLELSRFITTMTALAVVFALLARGARGADARSLVLFLLLAVIGYEKIFSSNVYPGPLQEHIATGLLNAGVTRPVLRWFFGPLAWPLWPAGAALLRFSAVFPRPLDPSTLDASGRQDRRGFMRSSSLAGADIGALFRRVSRTMLQRGAFNATVLAVASVVLVVMHTAMAGSALRAVAYVVAFLTLCVVATNLRAAYLASAGRDRSRAAWIVEGFVLALFMFLASALLLLLVPLNSARIAAFMIVMLMPAAVIVCLALSVLSRGEADSGAIDRTVRAGTTALAVILTFGLLNLVLGALGASLGMPRAVAAIAALVGAALAFGPVQRATDRFRLRVLERDEATTGSA